MSQQDLAGHDGASDDGRSAATGADRPGADRIAELEALVARMARRQDELEAEVVRLRSATPIGAASAAVVSAATGGTEEPSTRPVDRRSLLGSAGRAAAGALAGGAVLAVTQAQPAAAAAGTFDGGPAVSATNTGGIASEAVRAVGGAGTGVWATSNGGGNLQAVLATNLAASGGVGVVGLNQSSSNTTAIAVRAIGNGGTGLTASTNAATQSVPGADVSTSGAGGLALRVRNLGDATGVAASIAGAAGTGLQVTGNVGATVTSGVGLALLATSGGSVKDGSAVGVKGVANDAIGVIGTSTNSIGGQLTGGACDLRLGGLGVGSGAPATRNHAAGHSRGDLAQDTATGDLWLCVVAGAAGQVGTWRKLAGAATSGALHALATPKRVFDSRSGFLPNNVAKGAFVNQTKTIDAKNNASGVPAGATAVLVNLAVTNTNSGGYGALWAQGASPGTANINWGLANSTISNTVLTALKADGTFQCQIAGTADVIIDVIGYYL